MAEDTFRYVDLWRGEVRVSWRTNRLGVTVCGSPWSRLTGTELQRACDELIGISEERIALLREARERVDGYVPVAPAEPVRRHRTGQKAKYG